MLILFAASQRLCHRAWLVMRCQFCSQKRLCGRLRHALGNSAAWTIFNLLHYARAGRGH